MSDAVARAGDQLAAELAASGFPRMPARVIMALTVSPEGRLTAAELGKDLDASPAAISGAVRYLQTLGFVRSSTVPGTRKHVYALPLIPWYATTLTQDRYGHIVEVLDAAFVELPDGGARERIAEMAEFFRFLQLEMPQLWARWKEAGH
ncbi:MAG: helix-turn-helix domain-containing protein [Pseudolysinimonas sp.]